MTTPRKTLHVGDKAPEVAFLRERLAAHGVIDDPPETFADITFARVEEFQRKHNLKVDGAVGPLTWAALESDPQEIQEPAPVKPPSKLPPKPDFRPLSLAEVESIFGKFKYKAAPTAANPEAIQILDNWPANNIRMVEVPELYGVTGVPPIPKVPFHRLAQPQLVALWMTWNHRNLLHLVKTWDGSWAPRFKRGTQSLSNHAIGTAFDINARWNMLGHPPAPAGADGSVAELVPIANALGFFWGGHFTRPDAMHFEIGKLMTKEELSKALDEISHG